jgi:ribosomal protein S12 methylthiotransferase
VTLGCPKNEIDSEGLGGLLQAAGHDVVEQPERADVVVVNTCGFIDPARRETVQETLELADLKQTSGLKALLLTGCLVARSASELAEALPEVDALVDFAAYPRIATIVEQAAAGALTERVHGRPGTRFDPAYWDAALAGGPRVRFGRAPWAYVKIAEGCDRGCAFCAIPLMRGRFRSRPSATIEAEVRHLAELGVGEFSLVSQDSVFWGRDTGEGGLSDLLARLERVDGVRRLRLMYLHPQGVTEELIERVLTSEKICSYFDLSLQHVSRRVLTAMGRPGDRARFEGLIDRIRASEPLAGLRATFILGFPGESDADAAEVEDFVAGAGLDHVGVFTYSPEEGTRGAALPDQVPEVIARARTERVAAAAEIAMAERAASLRGCVFKVLCERYDPASSLWYGRSHREAPEVDGVISFSAPEGTRVGDLLEVVITGSEGADLSGHALS